ncbi:MAG: hypothetical protein IJF04_02075, partial [Oscillospiraceae bacterium]|nr:hypothetical protein [Oscillospiraceae bacterium]
MKKALSFAVVLVMILTFAACSHTHVPGPAATCYDPQICTECEEVLVEATGHRPGPAATCEAPQTCEFCGLELTPKLEHTPGAE